MSIHKLIVGRGATKFFYNYDVPQIKKRLRNTELNIEVITNCGETKSLKISTRERTRLTQPSFQSQKCLFLMLLDIPDDNPIKGF